METQIMFLTLSIIFNCPTYEADQQQLSNYEKTKNYYNSLLDNTSGRRLKIAELIMFMSMIPKGGDLHHHYDGAIYAETYLEWAREKNYCIRTENYAIESSPKVINSQKNLPLNEKSCISIDEVRENNNMYTEFLKQWSNKDFEKSNLSPHFHYFNIFVKLHHVSTINREAGLKELKNRAILENVQYLETIMDRAPTLSRPDESFDEKIAFSSKNDVDTTKLFSEFTEFLKNDQKFNEETKQHMDHAAIISSGLDEHEFTLRFQSFVLRNDPPSVVFSGLYSAFLAASNSSSIVGVNLVGLENGFVSMRDYTLHMKMIRFLKEILPNVRVSLHAGELVLGTVPPEGLGHHVRDAVFVAKAERIGHGVDIVSEYNPLEILQEMSTRKIPVEINLSSNECLLGVKDEYHPITVYMASGVPLVICSDDAGILRNNLSNQYVLFASRYNVTYGLLKETIFNSIRYSFLKNDEKIRHLSILEKKFDEFEKKIGGYVSFIQTRS